MKTKLRRLTALILTIVLCLCISPITVNATETNQPEAGEGSGSTPDSGWAEGVGGYETADVQGSKLEVIKTNIDDNVYGAMQSNIEATLTTVEKLSSMPGVPEIAAQAQLTKLQNLVKEFKYESTRAFGYAVFLITVNISDKSQLGVVSAMESQAVAPTAFEPLGYIRLGGRDCAFTGNIDKSIVSKVNGLAGGTPDMFFEILNEINPGISARYLEMFKQAKQGKGNSIPAIIMVPCVGTPNGIVNAYDIGAAPYCFGPSCDQTVVSKMFAEQCGTTVFDFVTVTNVTLTGNKICSGYGIAWEGEVPSKPDPGTFYANASPEKAGVVWAVQTAVTGTYNVYNTLTQLDFDNATGGYIEIKVDADFGTGNTGRASNATLTAGTPTVKLINENRWKNVAQFSGSGSSATVRIPVTHMNTWNDYGGFVFSVPITGGSDTNTEECRPADFRVTVNGSPASASTAYSGDHKWIANGTVGNVYTSWIGGLTQSQDVGYDFHTTMIPHGESLVVANTAKDDEATFDASIGIPSTENVSIKTGAEAGMADVYGYLCVRPYDGNITVANTSNEGEDELGVSQSNPAATREITLKAQVVNCWGSNNPVCQLSRGVVWSKSGGSSHDDGHVDQVQTHSCPGHSCSAGSVGGGSYTDEHHSASEFRCGNHYSGEPGWTSYQEWHNGNCGSSNLIENTDSEGNVTSTSCGCSGCSSGSAPSNNHDCSYSVTVYDAVNGDEFLGQSLPLEGTATGVNTNHPLLEISRASNCGINIHWKISWKPSQDKQYYIVTYDVWNSNISSGASGCHSTSRGAQGNVSWGTSGTHYKGNNSDSVLCDDYTHGTGTSITHYENIAHQGCHEYTIKYTETVDAYTYKTIENATVYSLTSISLDKLHELNVSYPSKDDDINSIQIYRDIVEEGTYSAPISHGVGESVSSPEAIGYLWRCVGGNEHHGEYESGNGRILWEAWKNKDVISQLGGNCSVVTTPTDYFLGDVEVQIKAIQDSEWGSTIANETTWEPTASGGITNQGQSKGEGNHIHTWNYKSLNDYEANCEDNKYMSKAGTGDCTETGNVSTLLNNSGNHNEIVNKELTAVMNFWCGFNSGLAGGSQIYYKANIISDTFVYGGTSMTNSLIEDAYSVDGPGEEDGVPLFNIHAENVSSHIMDGSGGNPLTDDTGSKHAYRAHKSAYGGGNSTALKLLLKAGTFSSASTDDAGSMGLFGGINQSGQGGNVGVGTTIAHQMQNSMTTFGVGCSATKGDTVSSVVYKRSIEPYTTHSTKTSGITTVKVMTTGTTSNQEFAGYWRDFVYETKGSGTIQVSVNNTNTGSSVSSEYGMACIEKYGTLAISNLPLVSWTPNGSVYTGQVGSHYVSSNIASAAPPPEVSGPIPYKPRTEMQDSHDKVVSGDILAPCGANGTEYLNAIKIYNPISTEYDHVIGAQYGKFEDSKYVSDDLKYDQRIDSSGNYLTDNPNYSSTTKPYVVQSRYLWSWLSPYGNFNNVPSEGHGDFGGSDTLASLDSKTEANKQTRNSGKKGYVDKMFVNKWIYTESFKYPFIAGFSDNITHTKSTNTEVDRTYCSVAHSGVGGKSAGQAISSKLPKDKYYYGNAFGVTNTCNIVETDMDNDKSPVSYVTFTAYAINPFVLTSDSYLSGDCFGGYIDAQVDNAPSSDDRKDMLANRVSKAEKVNLVGSIGNVTVHDVEDFRFSNYFKTPTSDWLIDGVIREVNENAPRRVVSSHLDIMQNPVNFYIEKGSVYNINGNKLGSTDSYTALGHSSLGTTLYDPGLFYGGMAGPYDELPLVPRYNTIAEYKTEAVRLGYKAFISVDTIGNYQSYIPKGTSLPDGPDDADTRQNYLSVQSQYYLYDFDDGKFYDVDIWSGSTGGKERLYNGTTKKTERILQAGSIYQDVYPESSRRNIGPTELLLTMVLLGNTDVTEATDLGEYTITYGNRHYIGQPGNIKLDNRDLTYIGSSNNDSDRRYWGKSYGDTLEFSKNAQRYHFKDGITSTTILTEPLGDNPSQGEILAANKKVQEEHPHSVLVQFMDFTAKGTIWTIKVNGSAVNQPTFTVFDTSDPKFTPQDWEWNSTMESHNEVHYQGTKTYNPITGNESGKIDEDLTPIIVFQAFNTSADDRTVAGTH